MLILVAFPFISMAIMPCMHYITINFSWLVVLLSLIANTQPNSSVPSAFHWFTSKRCSYRFVYYVIACETRKI